MRILVLAALLGEIAEDPPSSSRRTAAPAARVCERRIFEPATSSIAFVTFAMEVTERTRRLICLMDAMSGR